MLSTFIYASLLYRIHGVLQFPPQHIPLALSLCEYACVAECFRHFPIIRELEMSLNAVRNIKLAPEDFPHLEVQ